MDKKLIGLIVGVAVLGVGFFLFTQSGLFGGGLVDTDNDSESFSGSIQDLFHAGREVACDFSRTDEFGDMSGTVYVSSESFRGDFTLAQDGESFDSHIIHDGEFVYTWGTTPLGETGFKFKATDTGSGVEAGGEGQTSAPDLEEDFDYSCRPWGVNSSLFNPPADVEFQDLSAMMEGTMMESGGGVPTGVDCSACDSVPAGAAQDQCKKALGC